MIQACLDLKTIEICDVNIVSFVYCGYDSINLRISNVPLRSEVTLSKECWRKDFIRGCLYQTFLLSFYHRDSEAAYPGMGWYMLL